MPLLLIVGVLLFVYVTKTKGRPSGIVVAANKLINTVLAVMFIVVFGFIAMAFLGVGKGG